MASTLIKITSIGGGLATATGAGIGIAYLTSDTPQKVEEADKPTKVLTKQPLKISDLLATNKLRLLTKESEDDGKWEENWKKLVQNNTDTAPKAPWGFKNWKTTKAEVPVPNEFKTECEKHGAGTALDINDDTYKAVSTYCSKSSDE